MKKICKEEDRIMKKIFIAIAAMAAVFASCQKTEISDSSSNEIKLDITVADLGSDSPATKAKIKSGWTNGDQISIYYDTNTEKAFDLSYDGSKWTGPESITAPDNASGNVKCLYNGDVKVASTVAYTYSGSTLSFNINSWTFLTEIQVVVTGLSSSDAANYTLACDKFTPLSGDGYAVGSDAITASKGTKGAAVTGIANTDGVAFVFATADYSDSEQNFLFTLANTTDALKTRVVKGYSFNKTIAAGTSQIKAYKIAYTKFQEAVQLWADGPYWAYNNVGAESGTGYGYYFAWGYTDGYVRNSSNDGWVKAADSFSSITFDATGFSDYQSHTFADMTAANWGSNWRMPTKDELKTLINNDSSNKSSVSYVTEGIKGIKITGTETGYTANSIFLPATGNGNNSDLISAGVCGFYWASTQKNITSAWYLYFNPDSDNPSSFIDCRNKCRGYTVRPVRSSL